MGTSPARYRFKVNATVFFRGLAMTHGEQRAAAVEFFKAAHTRFATDGLTLIVLKGADYAPEPVAMTEVFFTAADISTSAEQILWVHVRKHLSAIANYMAGQQLKSEDIRSRLLDVANYMALIDSYLANPAEWLDHLIMLLNSQQFPHRSQDERIRLQHWVAFQCGAVGVPHLAALLVPIE